MSEGTMCIDFFRPPFCCQWYCKSS